MRPLPPIESPQQGSVRTMIVAAGNPLLDCTSPCPTPCPPPNKTPRRLAHWTRDTWITELLAMTASVACTVAICTILNTFNASNNRVPDLPEAVNLNAIISTLSTVSSSLMMYAISAAIGQAKWNWFRAQPQPLHHLKLLDEATRGPLGSLQMLFAGTARSLATLGALVALLNLAIAPFVQQVIHLSTAPSPPLPTPDATFPVMTLPSFYFNATSEAAEDLTEAKNSAIWSDNGAPTYTQRARCHTGNCTWPLVDTLEWCVETEEVVDFNYIWMKCPLIFNFSNSTNFTITRFDYHNNTNVSVIAQINDFTAENSTRCDIHLQGTSEPLTASVIYSFVPTNGPLPFHKVTVPVEVVAPLRTFNTTLFGQDTFMGVADPVLSMGYAQFSVPSVKRGRMSLLSLQQAFLTLCKKTYNVSMTQGNISVETVSSDYGRFYQDEAAAKMLDSNDAWCWAPSKKGDVAHIEIRHHISQGNVTFLSDPNTMAFCTNSTWLLAQDIAARLSGINTISHTWPKGPGWETPLNTTERMDTGPTYSSSWDSTEEIMTRIRARSLGRVMESTAAALNQIYISKTSQMVTGMSVTYETVVVVRWAWLALPIAVQALGLAFLTAVIVTSKSAPLWKGSVLAPLYHGLEHTPSGDDTVTGSGMAGAAKNTWAVLTRSSKTKTFLLGCESSEGVNDTEANESS